MVTALEGAPLVIFIDPRRGKGLTAAARRFVFSMMHEHIRVANPDFAAARLGIVQFGEAVEDQRPVKLSTDEGVELFDFDQLDRMVRETYDIRREVSEAREDEVCRKAAGGGHGPLFGWMRPVPFQPPPDGLPHPIPIGLLRAVAVVPRALVAGERLKFGVGIAGDNIIGHAVVDFSGGDQPRLYRVRPDHPQDQTDKDEHLTAKEGDQQPAYGLLGEYHQPSRTEP